jgi:hypothetical protein
MVDTKFLFFILVWIWTKHIMKIILIFFSQSELFISRFKTSIHSWKIWKKHENNKFGYGVKAFLGNQYVLFPYFSKNQCSTMMSCLAKNDHLKIVLWSIQIQMVVKTM